MLGLRSELIKFNIGTPEHPAYLCCDSSMKSCTIEPAAQVLTKKKMIELGFVHPGWGPNHGKLLHDWYTWHVDSRLYDETTDAKIRARVLKYRKECIKNYSDQFKKRGARTNREDVQFCRTCGVKTPEFQEGHTVIFADWAKAQAADPNWNGVLSPPGEMLCHYHMVNCVAKSVESLHYTDDERHRIRDFIESLKLMQQA